MRWIRDSHALQRWCHPNEPCPMGWQNKYDCICRGWNYRERFRKRTLPLRSLLRSWAWFSRVLFFGWLDFNKSIRNEEESLWKHWGHRTLDYSCYTVGYSQTDNGLLQVVEWAWYRPSNHGARRNPWADHRGSYKSETPSESINIWLDHIPQFR